MARKRFSISKLADFLEDSPSKSKSLKRRKLADMLDELVSHCPEQVEALLLRLTRETGDRDQTFAANRLICLLRSALPMERIRLLADWTLDSHPGPREVIASALVPIAPVLGEVSALALLSSDDVPAVRQAAAQAMGARLSNHPLTYIRGLRLLSTDSHLQVRRAANLALVVGPPLSAHEPVTSERTHP